MGACWPSKDAELKRRIADLQTQIMYARASISAKEKKQEDLLDECRFIIAEESDVNIKEQDCYADLKKITSVILNEKRNLGMLNDADTAMQIELANSAHMSILQKSAKAITGSAGSAMDSMDKTAVDMQEAADTVIDKRVVLDDIGNALDQTKLTSPVSVVGAGAAHIDRLLAAQLGIPAVDSTMTDIDVAVTAAIAAPRATKKKRRSKGSDAPRGADVIRSDSMDAESELPDLSTMPSPPSARGRSALRVPSRSSSGSSRPIAAMYTVV